MLKLPHLSRRFVSTGLSSAFNKLHTNLKASKSFFKSTGLFGIEQLKGPDGFHVLRDKAQKESNLLVQRILSASQNGEQHKIVRLLDELSNSLCKVADLAEFVRAGHPHERFRATAEQASITISTLVEKLNTDPRLYQSLKSTLNEPINEDNIDEYVTKLFINDFEQSGIHLDDKKRETILHLNENILRIGSIFSAHANEPRCVDKSILPDEAKHFFSYHGDKAYVSGLFADSDNAALREAAYRIYLHPDKNQDNRLTQLLQQRLQLADLCGFESYSHRAVKGSIAGEPEIVWDFLNILNERIRPVAAIDYNRMLNLKNKTHPFDKVLNAWDVPYYSSNYKKNIHDENIVQCLPYFSIGSCMDGLNLIIYKLYGVKMQVDECNNSEIWNSDVIKLKIIDGSSDELLGYIYCDLFERPMKQHQDCHHTIQCGYQLGDGTYQLPIVVLMLSLPDNNPSLLSPSMVDNLFHEMGHAMHSMLARTKYQHVTGTRCSTDLAEVPSILMEFFASDPRVISQFARHYATGEQMPADLMNSWIKSKKIFTASETQLQVFYAALDQAYHSSEYMNSTKSTTDILADLQNTYYSIPYVENTAWQLRFAHLVSYGAKYYSYLVSRAIASAIWNKLFSDDPLSRKAGLKYKDQLLCHGGGRPAKRIVEEVLARKVDAEFIADCVVKEIHYQ